MKKEFKGRYGSAKLLGTDTLLIGGKKETFLVYIYVVNIDGKKVQGKVWINPKKNIVIPSKNNLKPTNIVVTVKDLDVNRFIQSMLDNKVSIKDIKTFNISSLKSESLYKLQLLVSLVSMLFTLYFLSKYFITNILKTKVEFSANDAEEKLNEYLFKSHKKDDPKFKVYSEVIYSLESVINDTKKGIIIGGPPGTGKTYITRRTFYLNGLKYGKDYEIVKGTALDISAVYEYLYKNRNRIVVFDDFDKPLETSDTVNLLKSATDSYPVRILSLVRSSTVSTGSNSTEYAPAKFEYKGKIVILTNLPESKIDMALRSRLGYIHLYFNPKQMLKVIQVMIDNIYPDVNKETKQEVFKFLEEYVIKHPNKQISIRTFKNLIDLRILYPNSWKQIATKIL